MVESEFKPIRVRHEGTIRLSASGRSLRIDLNNGKRYYCDVKKVQEVLHGKRKTTTLYSYLDKQENV